MPKSCPSCGAVTLPKARFCRQCGIRLKPASNKDDSTAISPQSATARLSNESLTRDDLATEKTERTLPHTTLIEQSTPDDLLQRPRAEQIFKPEATARAGPPTLIDEQSRLTLPPTSGDVRPPAGPSMNLAKIALPDDDYDDEEEITITVPRHMSAATSTTGLTSMPMRKSASLPSHELSVSDEKTTGARWLWLEIAVAGAIVLCIVIAVSWLAVRSFRKPPSPITDDATTAATAGNPKELVKAKLSEAEGLLASGNREGAIARLREATRLDPSNIEAHRRLGDLLFRQSARREAIDEYRAIIQINANDSAAWRALASVQLAEGLYNEAAESYQRLIAISVATGSSDDTVQISYANALRLAGRVEEARMVYLKLASSANVDAARAARQRLTELPPPLEAKDSSPDSLHNSRAALDQSRTTTESVVSPALTPIPSAKPTPAVIPALSANEHFNRGIALWPSNRAAAVAEFHAAANGGNWDANYYLGLNIVEGHDPHTLSRAELVAALVYFQRARRGKFSTPARQYEDQLGKEYDLRRQQKP